MPGSPNRGFSASVPSSASSTDTDSAPASISASDNASACSRATSMTISVQLILLLTCLRHLCQTLFQIVNVGAAFDEARVYHQLAVQRNVGRNAFDDHFRQRDLHAADRLLAGCAVGNDLADHRIVVRW